MPTIARWPGHLAAGSESNLVWAFWDFLPTAAELIGAPAPKALDGISIAPTLSGRPEEQTQHDYLYWEFYERGFSQAARRGDWKAVRAGEEPRTELYHLATDLGEVNNLAAAHPEIVREMEAIFSEAHVKSEHW